MPSRPMPRSSTLVGQVLLIPFSSMTSTPLLGGGFTNSIQTNSGYAVLVDGKGNSLNGDNSVLVGGRKAISSYRMPTTPFSVAARTIPTPPPTRFWAAAPATPSSRIPTIPFWAAARATSLAPTPAAPPSAAAPATPFQRRCQRIGAGRRRGKRDSRMARMIPSSAAAPATSLTPMPTAPPSAAAQRQLDYAGHQR